MAVKTPEEIALAEAEQKAYKKLAEELNASSLQLNEKTKLTLWSPTLLTVMHPDGQFKKANHIGGEEFVFESAYVGKRGVLIFRLKRTSPVEYQHVEVTEAEGVKLFENWRAMTNSLAGGDFAEALADVTKVRKTFDATKRNAEHLDKYDQIGGGSW